MRYLYLHGFASGPTSRKAQAFQSSLAARGIQLEVPALDEGDFENLTLSRQLSLIERTLKGDPVRLAGSSMGGYLAALYASTHPEVERLVLLAPAFSFSERWQDLMTPAQMSAWRDSGSLDVFHYGEKRMRPVSYQLLDDALRYPGYPDFRQPAKIFHGTRDTVVPIGLSRAFAASHPNTSLTELDSDHELLNVLPEIASSGVEFLTPTDSAKQTQ